MEVVGGHVQSGMCFRNEKLFDLPRQRIENFRGRCYVAVHDKPLNNIEKNNDLHGTFYMLERDVLREKYNGCQPLGNETKAFEIQFRAGKCDRIKYIHWIRIYAEVHQLSHLLKTQMADKCRITL